MSKEERAGSRTLLWSVLMSAPGPLVVGLGLLTGRSSTQIADFVRRSAELLAIIMSFAVYRMTADEADTARKAALERRSNTFVGAMMCLGGTFMVILTLLGGTTDKGNVIPGLTIAVLGVIANAIFWRRYAKLNCAKPNAILLVQARLYRAKTLVDGCVTAALLAVAAAPGSPLSSRLDFAGSLVVALYLVHCGVKTIRESRHRHTDRQEEGTA